MHHNGIPSAREFKTPVIIVVLAGQVENNAVLVRVDKHSAIKCEAHKNVTRYSAACVWEGSGGSSSSLFGSCSVVISEFDTL